MQSPESDDGTTEDATFGQLIIGGKLQLASVLSEALLADNGPLRTALIRGEYKTSDLTITHQQVAGRVAEYVNELVDGLLGA